MLSSAFAAVVLVANAGAAVVTLNMTRDTSGPGTWQLFAEASSGDNGGIASFNIPLLDIATLTNEAPFYTLNTTNFRPAGFSELRVPATDNNAVDKTVFASQQLIPNPTPNIVYGFGQTAGSWPASSYVPAAPWKQPSWDANLLLASGTYATGAQPRVNIDATNLSVLVFDNATGTEVIAATPVIGVVDDPPPVINDVDLGEHLAAIIHHTFIPDAGSGPITNWSIAPLAGSPFIPATIGQTGQFEWHTLGSQFGAAYSWTITAANAIGSDTAVLSLRLGIIPEPATMPLFCIAIIGLVGFARRGS
jgi:hypothetical protein